MLQYFAGIAGGDNVRRNVMGDHGTGADGDIVAYRDSGQDGNTAANPDIVPDRNRFGPFSPAVPLDGIGAVTRRINAHIGADEAVVADGDRCLVQHREVEIGEETFSHAYLLPIIAEKGLVDNNFLVTDGAQQSLEDAQALFLQRRSQGVITMYHLPDLAKFLQQVLVNGRINLPGKHFFFLGHFVSVSPYHLRTSGISTAGQP